MSQDIGKGRWALILGASSGFGEACAQVLAGAGGPNRLEQLRRSLACHAAVRAGQRVSAGEIAGLLEGQDQQGRSTYCPHGRPAEVFFSREEVARWFKRK